MYMLRISIPYWIFLLAILTYFHPNSILTLAGWFAAHLGTLNWNLVATSQHIKNPYKISLRQRYAFSAVFLLGENGVHRPEHMLEELSLFCAIISAEQHGARVTTVRWYDPL